MKATRILLSMLVALVIAMPLTAADQAAKKAKPAKLGPVSQALLQMQRLHKALESVELSEDQKGEVKKIHDEVGPKMKESLDKLGEVITEEQRKAAEAAAKEAKEAGKEDRDFFLAVQSSIELTAEQEEKMAEIGKELMAIHRESMKRSLAILTDEQREQVTAKAKLGGGKKAKKKSP